MIRSPLLRKYLVLSLLGAAGAQADPQLERDFSALREEHSRAVAAALTPINKRYVPLLEKLLARAKQAGGEADQRAIAQAIDRARLSTQTEAALAAFLPGSRWMWFDTSKPTSEKRDFWMDFYRDGVAKTSWGTTLRYAIDPPAGLRISQSMPPLDWYLTVDIAKKVAVADDYASFGHEKRSMVYERSIPPIVPK